MVNPNNYHFKAGYFVELGNLTQDLKMYELATTAFTEAIKLDPENSLFLIDRANFYKSRGENELASADIEKVRGLEKEGKGSTDILVQMHINNILKELGLPQNITKGSMKENSKPIVPQITEQMKQKDSSKTVITFNQASNKSTQSSNTTVKDLVALKESTNFKNGISRNDLPQNITPTPMKKNLKPIVPQITEQMKPNDASNTANTLNHSVNSSTQPNNIKNLIAKFSELPSSKSAPSFRR